MSSANRWGIGILLLLILLALLGPAILPDPLARTGALTGIPLAPSAAHWLGTDQYSRDVLARLAGGAATSLTVGGIAIVVASTLGVVIGLIAGAVPGVTGKGAQRFIELALALPRVVVLLVVLTGTGSLAIGWVGLTIGLTGWPAIARLVSAEAQRLRELDWVAAARALGATPRRVLLRELLPGTLPPVIVAATLGLADAMLLEAGLSFLGLGVHAADPSWGNMINEAKAYLGPAPWMMLAPAVALGLATTAATLLGDSLRRTLQPGSQ